MHMMCGIILKSAPEEAPSQPHSADVGLAQTPSCIGQERVFIRDKVVEEEFAIGSALSPISG